MMQRYVIDIESGEVHRGDLDHGVPEENLTPASQHRSVFDALDWVRALHDSGQGLSKIRPTACPECFDG